MPLPTNLSHTLNAVANLGSLVIAGLGGALTPINSLPGWARAIAPASPAYWTMRGFRSVIIGAASAADVLGSIGVLVAFCLVFLTVVTFRFRLTTEKQSYYG